MSEIITVIINVKHFKAEDEILHHVHSPPPNHLSNNLLFWAAKKKHHTHHDCRLKTKATLLARLRPPPCTSRSERSAKGVTVPTESCRPGTFKTPNVQDSLEIHIPETQSVVAELLTEDHLPTLPLQTHHLHLSCHFCGPRSDCPPKSDCFKSRLKPDCPFVV